MTVTVQDRLAGVPDRALRRTSRVLAASFSRALLIGTLHDGDRLDDADDALRDDLDALAAAMPPDRLSRDPAWRDAASSEPAMLTAIRQAEGSAPLLPAVIRPRTADEAQSLLAEASAAGFEPGGEAARRAIGLSFDAMSGAQCDGSGIQTAAGTSWEELQAAADRAGRGLPMMALSGRFLSPALAAPPGLFTDARIEWFRGRVQSACLSLPPSAVGATDKSWFVPANVANAVLEQVVAHYTPLFAETLTPTDVAVLSAAGLIPGKPKGRAVLRVVCEGTRGVRAATMGGIGVAMRRAGGRLCQRGPLPDDAMLISLAACSGAARLATDSPPEERPPGAVVEGRSVAIRGRLREETIVWYARDLARSIDQAAALLAGPAAPRKRPRADDDSWDALRAALAEALP